jgi:hypothetical protein
MRSTVRVGDDAFDVAGERHLPAVVMRQRSPAPAPAPRTSTESTPATPGGAGRGIATDGTPGADVDDDEASYEPTDPHPDTPDDFDEDASSPRQSEEALPEDD